MTRSIALAFLLACSPTITETRMLAAAPREAGCALELVYMVLRPKAAPAAATTI